MPIQDDKSLEEKIKSIRISFYDFHNRKECIVPITLYTVILGRYLFDLIPNYFLPYVQAYEVVCFLTDACERNMKPKGATDEMIADVRKALGYTAPKGLLSDEYAVFAWNVFTDVCKKYKKNLREVNSYYSKKYKIDAIALLKSKPEYKMFLSKQIERKIK